MEDKTAEGSIEMIFIGVMVTIEAGIDQEKLFSGSYSSNRTRSTSNSRLRSGYRASSNRDRIRCYNCRQYNHFVRVCSTSREERDLDQLQLMLNLEEEEQTHLLNSRQK